MFDVLTVDSGLERVKEVNKTGLIQRGRVSALLLLLLVFILPRPFVERRLRDSGTLRSLISLMLLELSMLLVDDAQLVCLHVHVLSQRCSALTGVLTQHTLILSIVHCCSLST